MGKIIIGLLAVVGCLFVVNAYAPSLWTHGFHVAGLYVRVVYLVVGAVVFMAYKLKSK